jgi:hypothetical protein
MSTAEVLEQLKHLSNAERLAVIEAASRLIRQDLLAGPSDPHAAQDRRMRDAALALKDLYEPGDYLTEWT